MPLTEDIVTAAANTSEIALVIIGRTAGEDKDNSNTAGSYQLTDLEEEMLSLTSKAFEHVVVVLNVGNIMDMSFMDRYAIDSVLYAWQGGVVGGLGTVDVLTGKTSPSGKLTDTIAYDITDYPSDENFGNPDKDYYTEDIYVGYRYFETVAKDKVRYPFGFGLSYTSFSLSVLGFEKMNSEVRIRVKVTNTGTVSGKEVVQFYVNAPQGLLGKPEKVLVAFDKTTELAPHESQELDCTIPLYYFASYDDTGVTGYPYSYVLEPGNYRFIVGTDVRTGMEAGSFRLDDFKVMETLTQAYAPVESFERFKMYQLARKSVV